MKVLSIIGLLTLVLEGTICAHALSDSITDCVAVADEFRNTCTTPREIDPQDHTWESVSDMESELITCHNWPDEPDIYPCIGTLVGTDCMWNRTLCVTCYESRRDDVTMIRIQTNNMPDHCPGNALVEPQNFDYQVRFNMPDPSPVFYKNEEITKEVRVGPGQTEWRTYNNEATAEVCPLHHQYNDDQLISENGSTESARALAIAINGVAFQNANQQDDDPVFPHGLGSVEDQPLDLCMGHNQRNSDSGMYHYHFFSPCLNKNFQTIDITDGMEVGTCVGNADCENDVTQWALEGYQQGEWNEKKIIGLSKDGRPLYGPYKTVGQLWAPGDVDACNMVTENNDRFYVATRWHPYISGCQGPTNQVHNDAPPYYANCSTNGIEEFMDACETPMNSCSSHQHCCGTNSFCDFDQGICTDEPPVLDDIDCVDVDVGCRISSDCCGDAICKNMFCKNPFGVTPSPVTSPGCVEDRGDCLSDEECCSGSCNNAGRCRRTQSTPAPVPTPTVAPTPTPTAAPTEAPTAAPTPAPTSLDSPTSDCIEDRGDCVFNDECCSGSCNSRGRCRRTQSTAIPITPAPVQTPPGCVENGNSCQDDSDCCSTYCNPQRNVCRRSQESESFWS